MRFYEKLIVSSVLAFITFSAQAAAFQVTSNEIKQESNLQRLMYFLDLGVKVVIHRPH